MPIAAATKKKLLEAMSDKNLAKVLPEGWLYSKWEDYGVYTVLVLKKGNETLRMGFSEKGAGVSFYASAHGIDVAMLGDAASTSEDAKVLFERLISFFVDAEI